MEKILKTILMKTTESLDGRIKKEKERAIDKNLVGNYSALVKDQIL